MLTENVNQIEDICCALNCLTLFVKITCQAFAFNVIMYAIIIMVWCKLTF